MAIIKVYKNPVTFIATYCCGYKIYQNPVSFIATNHHGHIRHTENQYPL
jgi:hypothetical protein